MKFKEAFIILAPEVDPATDCTAIDTPKYTCYTVLVQDVPQALAEAKKLVEREGVKAISLCPGFSNQAVSQVAETVGSTVAVCVARGDVPSIKIIGECIAEAQW